MLTRKVDSLADYFYDDNVKTLNFRKQGRLLQVPTRQDKLKMNEYQ